jgi:hypothetical protein
MNVKAGIKYFWIWGSPGSDYEEYSLLSLLLMLLFDPEDGGIHSSGRLGSLQKYMILQPKKLYSSLKYFLTQRGSCGLGNTCFMWQTYSF